MSRPLSDSGLASAHLGIRVPIELYAQLVGVADLRRRHCAPPGEPLPPLPLAACVREAISQWVDRTLLSRPELSSALVPPPVPPDAPTPPQRPAAAVPDASRLEVVPRGGHSRRAAARAERRATREAQGCHCRHASRHVATCPLYASGAAHV